MFAIEHGMKWCLTWVDTEGLKIARPNMYLKYETNLLQKVIWLDEILLSFYLIHLLIILWMLKKNLGRYFNIHKIFTKTCVSVLAELRIKFNFYVMQYKYNVNNISLTFI